MRDAKQVLKEMLDRGKLTHMELDENDEGREVIVTYLIHRKRAEPQVDEPTVVEGDE